jgi:hypothetical protein
MRTAIAVALLVFLSALPAQAQSEQAKVIKSCPVITEAEAAAVLGPRTIFSSGVEGTSGTTRISLMCGFVLGDRTLVVQATRTLGDRKTWEALRQLSNGSPETGLGDYAFSAFDDGKAEVFAVKGRLTVELHVAGEGTSPADVPKVREAARKVFPRI